MNVFEYYVLGGTLFLPPMTGGFQNGRSFGSTNEKNGELGYRTKPLLNLVTAMGKHQRGDYLFMCLIDLIYKKIYEILVFYWNGMSCDQKFPMKVSW